MLIYNGVRVSELLDLKKENIHLPERYFDVVDSETENGIRKVPIAEKVLPFTPPGTMTVRTVNTLSTPWTVSILLTIIITSMYLNHCCSA